MNAQIIVHDAEALKTYRAAVTAARKARAGQKPYACLECGHRMSGTSAARACDRGCPKCGGVDIDFVREPAPPQPAVVVDVCRCEGNGHPRGPWCPEGY